MRIQPGGNPERLFLGLGSFHVLIDFAFEVNNKPYAYTDDGSNHSQAHQAVVSRKKVHKCFHRLPLAM